jgi:hypothetical protein
VHEECEVIPAVCTKQVQIPSICLDRNHKSLSQIRCRPGACGYYNIGGYSFGVKAKFDFYFTQLNCDSSDTNFNYKLQGYREVKELNKF